MLLPERRLSNNKSESYQRLSAAASSELPRNGCIPSYGALMDDAVDIQTGVNVKKCRLSGKTKAANQSIKRQCLTQSVDRLAEGFGLRLGQPAAALLAQTNALYIPPVTHRPCNNAHILIRTIVPACSRASRSPCGLSTARLHLLSARRTSWRSRVEVEGPSQRPYDAVPHLRGGVCSAQREESQK